LAAGDRTFQGDINALTECEEFQKKRGKCDMKTFREFMKRRSEKMTKEPGRQD